jgi:hypothetical protein
MKRHVGAAALARFREGDLSPRKAARVSSHLAGCARCTDLSAELAGITMLLASTQAPAMPERLAVRIQDTLAAEAARRVALDPGTEPLRRDLPGRDGGHRRPRRRPGRWSPVMVRALAAAGAIVVAAGGGYLLISQNATNGSSGSASSAGVAAPAGTQHRAAASRPLAGPAATGPELRYGPPGGQASVVPVASGTNFVPAALAGQVTAALSQVRNGRGTLGAATTPSAAPVSPDLGRFGGVSVSALQGCVSRIAARGRVLLVDVAKYQGRQATVIVVMPQGSADRQVWVVGPACSASRSDVIARQRMPGG